MGFTDKPSLSVWIITLGVGESVTKDDFETCSRAVDKSCVPKHSYLKGEIAWRYIVGSLLPQMVMRRRHIPRNKWAFYKTKQMEGTGKPYIALNSDTATGGQDPMAMGFSVAETGAAMAFAHSFGAKHQVTNIGVGIRAQTPGVSVPAYVKSHLHELTAKEERSISLAVTGDEATTTRRLNLILCVKDAYIKAIGQQAGFDYSRIDCDVPGKMMSVDGQSLAGWHIRLFAANLAPTEELMSHKAPLHYQVAVAVFRGGHGLKFSFAQSSEDLSSFVTFFDVREVVKAVPRLGEYDNSAMPPLDKIPLSGKNSLASITLSEKDRKKEVPPVPSIPQKYVPDTKYPTVDVKVPLPPTKGSNHYPPDIKYPYPPPPSSVNSKLAYPTSNPGKNPLPGTTPVPIGPAPAYSTTKLTHPHTHSQQPQPNPIHTARR